MWKPFKCRLFGEHDYHVCREPGLILLECTRCGHRSPGWNLSGSSSVRRVDSSLRLLLADADEVGRPVRSADAAVPGPWITRAGAGELRLTWGREDS